MLVIGLITQHEYSAYVFSLRTQHFYSGNVIALLAGDKALR